MRGRLAILAVAAVAGPAGAQPPPGPVGPASGPTVSPYINLARRGISPAINYYGIVRPQAQAESALQTLQSANLPNPFANSYLADDQPVATGNPFGFQNYRLYFQNQFASGGYGGLGGAGVGQSRPAAGAVRPTPAYGAPSPSGRRR